MDPFTIAWIATILSVMGMVISIAIENGKGSKIQKKAGEVLKWVFSLGFFITTLITVDAHSKLLNLHFQNGVVPESYESSYKNWKVQQYSSKIFESE